MLDEFIYLGSEKHGAYIAVDAEVSVYLLRTVVALDSSIILLEMKSGPSNPNQSKNIASWAPDENSLGVSSCNNTD